MANESKTDEDRGISRWSRTSAGPLASASSEEDWPSAPLFQIRSYVLSVAFPPVGPLNGECIRLQRLINIDLLKHIIALDRLVASHAGDRFDDFQESLAVAEEIQRLMEMLGIMAECPKCGQPAKLRCKKVGRSKTGQFQFEHYSAPEGSLKKRMTSHGGSSTFPSFRLMPTPAR